MYSQGSKKKKKKFSGPDDFQPSEMSEKFGEDFRLNTERRPINLGTWTLDRPF